MPRRPVFHEGDHVTKGDLIGRVERRTSPRTGRDYLTVRITSGARRGQYEFPEKGWTVDDGSYGGNERPDREEETYSGSEWQKTRHHHR